MTRILVALTLGLALGRVGTARAGEAAPPAPPNPPACATPAHRQLDFWLGDWDLVIRARSSPSSDQWSEARGTNHVTAPLGRCVVQESFHGDGPGSPWAGLSVSTYVPQLGQWRQTWVDDSGSFLAFRGGPEAGAFVLYGEPREQNGVQVQMRMVFRSHGRDALVWSWERGTVGGHSWTPMMEIRYTRQPAARR